MNEERIKSMLPLLQCPISKGDLTYDNNKKMLYSKEAKVFFPIKDDIITLLEEEAIKEEVNEAVK